LLKVLQLSSDVGKMRLGGPKPKNLSAKVDAVRKIQEHVWLLRNRPGGLRDSLQKLRL
jgi:hypothetical protein